MTDSGYVSQSVADTDGMDGVLVIADGAHVAQAVQVPDDAGAILAAADEYAVRLADAQRRHSTRVPVQAHGRGTHLKVTFLKKQKTVE